MAVKVTGPTFSYKATGILPAKPTKGDTYVINGEKFTVVNVICNMETKWDDTLVCDPMMEIVVV